MEENKVPKDEVIENKEKQVASAPVAPKSDFNEKIWQPLLRPVVALTVICLVTSLLLGLTNNITKPIIIKNTALAADETRRELLPSADGFEEMSLSEVPDGIKSMFKSTNDVGYIVEAYGRGYGGKVPVMVAFSSNGEIVGVTFLENNETPGLGKKLNTDTTFADQFVGKANQRIANNEVQAIANATISSNAATSGINAAIDLFNQEVMGNVVVQLTPEEVRQMLLPDAGSFTQLPIAASGITDAYLADNGNFIVYALSDGFRGNPVEVAVAMTPEGVVLNIWADTSTQTEGWGSVVGQDAAFISQFAGASEGEIVVGDDTTQDSFDIAADATITSRAVGSAVKTALAALEIVKEAA